MAMTFSKCKGPSLLLLIGLALLATTTGTTIVAARTLTQETLPQETANVEAAAAVGITGAGDPNKLTVDEWKFASAYIKAFEDWPPSKKAAQAAVSDVKVVDLQGNELLDGDVQAADGAVPQAVYSTSWNWKIITVYVSLDTSTWTVTVKIQLRLPWPIGTKNLSYSFKLLPSALCYTVGYPPFLSAKFCLSIVGRNLSMRVTLLGESVSVILLRW